MPLRSDEVRFDLFCGRRADGHWHGDFVIYIHAEPLRRLGLHPDQPTSAVAGPSPPTWWHAAAENNARRHRPGSRF